jgi:hydrogenase/urease accessory protein HupE
MKAAPSILPMATWSRRLLQTVAALAILFFSVAVFAHELRPAYLELREENPGEFSVLWKTPMLGEGRLALEPEFSGDAQAVTQVTTQILPGAAIQTWILRAPALRGQALRIRGLEGTMTDVLVRIEFRDGTKWVQRLTGQEPSASIPTRQSGWSVARVYLKLGVEHILFGADHMLFVLGLLLIVKDRWMLLKTITAFTVAHSITLGVATLGYASAPVVPLNAAIALSILFLGPEIVRSWRGESSFTIRNPWVVAFAFGLLHGFGFASALTSAGLPRTDLPLALLTFNVGVEIGQLSLVALVLLLERSFRILAVRWPRWVAALPGYTVGTLGAFWTIQRVAILLGGAR